MNWQNKLKSRFCCKSRSRTSSSACIYHQHCPATSKASMRSSSGTEGRHVDFAVGAASQATENVRFWHKAHLVVELTTYLPARYPHPQHLFIKQPRQGISTDHLRGSSAPRPSWKARVHLCRLPAEEAVSVGKGLNISPLRGAERLPTKDRTRPLGAPHPSLSCLAGLLGENTLIMPGLDPGIHSVSAQ